MTRILGIDDYPLLRQYVVEKLASQTGIEVVGAGAPGPLLTLVSAGAPARSLAWKAKRA
jgi:hypothetical protein